VNLFQNSSMFRCGACFRAGSRGRDAITVVVFGACWSWIILGALECGRECGLVMLMKSCVPWEAMIKPLPKSSGAWNLDSVQPPLGAYGSIINVPSRREDFQPHPKLDELMPVVRYVWSCEKNSGASDTRVSLGTAAVPPLLFLDESTSSGHSDHNRTTVRRSPKGGQINHVASSPAAEACTPRCKLLQPSNQDAVVDALLRDVGVSFIRAGGETHARG
jgi:hypothetical protein